MATVHYETTDSYVQITQVGSDLDFLLQSKHTTRYVDVIFADSTPDPSDPSHPLCPGGSMIRAGVVGNVYVRSHDAGEPVVLAVSAGA